MNRKPEIIYTPPFETHVHNCAFHSGNITDWNCYGHVADKLSLEANKIWLLTLFISTPDPKGVVHDRPGPLSRIQAINRSRQGINQNIKEMLQYAWHPDVHTYLVTRDACITKFALLDEQWIAKEQKIKQWFDCIALVKDVGGCRRLETEFNTIYRGHINYFLNLFMSLNNDARQQYLHVLKIMGHDETLFQSKSEYKYAPFFRENIAASVESDKSYYECLQKIISGIMDFHHLRELESCILAHADSSIDAQKKEAIDYYVREILFGRQLIKARLRCFRDALARGTFKTVLSNNFFLVTFINAIEAYENNITMLRKWIYPLPAVLSDPPVKMCRQVSKSGRSIPLLKLEKIKPDNEQFHNLPLPSS